MAITVDGRLISENEVVDVDGAARVHLLSSGDAFVIARGDATRDGRPLVGHATSVEWGRDALLRVGGRRLALRWHAGVGARRAAPEQLCRLCHGAFAEGGHATACACDALFHGECFELRADCPACGATP